MSEVAPPAPPATGVDSVDEVVAGVAELDERPLAEHAEVFEQAHAALRRTLDDPPAAG